MVLQPSILDALDERSRAIFRQIVDGYLETGEPVGSRNVSRNLPTKLSPASVRNVMADLEELGLIYSPHASAGRIPTEPGLRLFVDALLEVGQLSREEQETIKRKIRQSAREKDLDDMLADAGELLSGLSHCAGLVLADQQIARIRHIEFVRLEPRKALMVLVGEDGNVENRILTLPEGLTTSALTTAANYLNTHVRGMSLAEARERIEKELSRKRQELDDLAAKVVKTGLAVWSGGKEDNKSLIVRGRSHLITDLEAEEDLARLQKLFDDLETKEDLIHLLEAAEKAEGVRIFIGSESKLFSLSGSSLIIAPFQDKDHKIVGVLGVIGPTRLNYARIIPMVDYTAKLMSRVLP